MSLVKEYKQYKLDFPEERISFSRFKLLRQLEKTRKKKQTTYSILHAKYTRAKKRVEKLKQEVATLRKQVRSERKKRPKIVKYTTKKYIRKCQTCKKYEGFLNKPITTRSNNYTKLIKLIVGLENVSKSGDISDKEIAILAFASLKEYLVIGDPMKAFDMSRTRSADYLKRLRELGYLSVSEIAATEGHRVKNHYFITEEGKEKLNTVFHSITRKSHHLLK